MESGTESVVLNRFQSRWLIFNFARDQQGYSGGEAEMEHQGRNDTVEEPEDVLFEPHGRATAGGFASLAEVFEVRACVMKSIPKFMLHIVVQ